MPFKINLPAHLLMDRQLIGDRVKRLRRKRRWSQDDLAEAAGVSRNSVARMEGNSQGLSIDAYLAVADALGIPLWRLFRDGEDDERDEGDE